MSTSHIKLSFIRLTLVQFLGIDVTENERNSDTLEYVYAFRIAREMAQVAAFNRSLVSGVVFLFIPLV